MTWKQYSDSFIHMFVWTFDFCPFCQISTSFFLWWWSVWTIHNKCITISQKIILIKTIDNVLCRIKHTWYTCLSTTLKWCRYVSNPLSLSQSLNQFNTFSLFVCILSDCVCCVFQPIFAVYFNLYFCIIKYVFSSRIDSVYHKNKEVEVLS